MKNNLPLLILTLHTALSTLASPLFCQINQQKENTSISDTELLSKQLFKLLLLLEMQQANADCQTEHDKLLLEVEVSWALSLCHHSLAAADGAAEKVLTQFKLSIEKIESSSNLNQEHGLLINIIWDCIQSLNKKAVSHQSYPKGVLYNGFHENPNIPHPEELAIRRHLLPYDSKARKELDSLLNGVRFVESPEAFVQAGFTPLIPIHKNKIVIATHPALPDMVIKTYLDCYPVNKSGFPDWLWLARRCTLASKIRKSIAKNKFNHFTVPHKWLYPIPNTSNERVHALLIEEKMNLVSVEENREAWLTIPKEALKELLEIMISQGGQSYRPDNIWKTKGGKFAFIDTEYPHLPPRFLEIVSYLDAETQNYWKMLIIERICSQSL